MAIWQIPLIQVTWLVVTEVRSKSFRLLVTQHCHYNARPIYGSGSSVRPVLFFIIECGIACFLCTVHVSEVRTSSSSPWLPLCQISFLLWPPLLSWSVEKNRILSHLLTQSLTQLIWYNGNRSFRFGIWLNLTRVYYKLPSMHRTSYNTDNFSLCGYSHK